MTRVLLTGAGGFAGAHILEHILSETDWGVVALDSFRHRGKTSRIREVLASHPDGYARHPGEERVRVLTHDLRAPLDAQLDLAVGRVDYVISNASESHVDRSIIEPRPFIENNVALMLSLLEWMRGSDHIEKFLHVSTDEVYGPAPAGFNHVEGEPHRPSNPYSASKACQEDILYAYWRTYGLPIGISNTMNLIGERQDPEKFVPLVLSKILNGETVTIHAGHPKGATGDWRAGSRYYLHARNQADALRFLLETQPFPVYSDGAAMGRWNVVGEVEIDNLRMAQMIAAAADKPLRYEFEDWHAARPGHDLRYALDGSKMAALGWTPPVPLAASLEKTVHWTLEHPHWLLP